jgi:hypothetical protein
VNPVRDEAKKAKEEMETKNPQLKLKHDPTQGLPKEGSSFSNHANPHHLHHNHQHPGQFLRFLHPFFGEHPPGVEMMDRPDRAGRGIQMAVRMVAGELNIALANNRDHRERQRQHVPNQNPLPPANQD